MTPIIYTTTNYDLFRFHKQNRKAGSNRQLPKLIEELDLTPYVPIVVDEDFYIVDGQNRFLACKALGKPVYYVILPREYDTNSSIITLNKAQQAWRQDEFLHFWSSTKGGCWRDLEDFVNETKLNIGNALLVYNRKLNSTAVRKGAIEFDKCPLADDIVTFLKSEEVKQLRYNKTRAFVLSVCIAFEKYTPKQIAKLKRKLIIVPMCANYEQYLIAFDNILRK